MDNFDAHKWFKKQYLEEGMSDDNKIVAATEDGEIKITQDEMKRLHKGEVVRLSNGSTLSFVKEGMSDKEYAKAKEAERLENHPEKDKIKDIQKMMGKEKSLKEDDLDEIAFGAAGTDKRTGQVVGEIIELIRSTGVDVYEVMEELGQEFGMDVRP